METNPELDQQRFLDARRAKSAAYGHAFVKTLLILKELIKLDVTDLAALQKEMNEWTKEGLSITRII